MTKIITTNRQTDKQTKQQTLPKLIPSGKKKFPDGNNLHFFCFKLKLNSKRVHNHNSVCQTKIFKGGPKFLMISENFGLAGPKFS